MLNQIKPGAGFFNSHGITRKYFYTGIFSSVFFRVLPWRKCLSLSPGPHFSPRGEMIAQRFGFTADFLKKRNTDCISDRRKSAVDSKIKRGLVIVVRNAG